MLSCEVRKYSDSTLVLIRTVPNLLYLIIKIIYKISSMSFHNQNLEAFLKLLKEKPQLFPQSKRQELIELIEPLEDELETLSVAIAKWYEKYDEIVDAQLEILNRFILINNSGQNSTSPAALARFSKPEVGSVSPTQPQSKKEALLLYLS